MYGYGATCKAWPHQQGFINLDLRLKGANGGSIRILGGLFITISGEDRKNKKWSTRQLCYVAEGVTKLMLSREACVQLGIISDTENLLKIHAILNFEL